MMMTRWATVAWTGGLSLVLAASCTSEAPASEDPKGSCSALASACHTLSKNGGTPKECHDLGHAGDDNACLAKKTMCLAACPEGQAPADGGSDRAPAEGGSDGAIVDPACAAYCACLAGSCATIPGYPFSAPGACAAACAAQSSDERACFPKWCAKAESSRSTHDCIHAWGGLGLDECSSL